MQLGCRLLENWQFRIFKQYMDLLVVHILIAYAYIAIIPCFIKGVPIPMVVSLRLVIDFHVTHVSRGIA